MARAKTTTKKKGKKTGVHLTYTQYHRLMEDLHDLRVVAERRHEKTVPLNEMMKRLRKQGLV